MRYHRRQLETGKGRQKQSMGTDRPDKVEELESKWIEWANTHKVFPLEDKIWTERINFYHEKNSYQKGDY